LEQQTAGQQNNEPQNFEGWFHYAKSYPKLKEFIPSTFDIPCSTFDIFFTVSFPIKLAASVAGLTPETLFKVKQVF
jgi:hypothetical protein